MAASRTLSELVVREWLHDTAPPAPRPDASTGYWRFTKHRVTQGRWTGNTGRTAENVVREMDPDAVVREAEIGRSLAGDDSDTVRRAVILSGLGRLKSFFLSYDYY
jgi:nuclear pore complex protein Nup107